MRKLFMIACMMLFSMAMFAEKGDLFVGANLNYGLHSDYKNLGFGVKGQFEFIDNWRAEASYNYFFKKDHCTMWDVNFNAHYVFHIEDGFSVYPLAGLTALGAKTDIGDEVSTTKVGVNLGGGAEYLLTPTVKLNAELKYQLVSDFDRPVVSIGIAFAL